jgi:hypothetical protein
MLAASKGRIGTILALINAGANIHDKDKVREYIILL